MPVFEIINEADNTPAKRTAKVWVGLGVEFAKAKAKGVTSKEFAAAKGIAYTTFTKSMSRYKSEILAALELEKLKGKSAKGLSARERGLKMVDAFRASIREKGKASRPKEKSQEWFLKTVKAGVKGHQVVRPQVGRIYTFVYDAKNKDTLPYWDRFPLIIYLGEKVTKSGGINMMGLNLHYINPKARQQFLEALLKQHASTPTLSNKTRLKIKWSDVRGMRGSDQMIKAYLPSHLKSKFIEIAPKDWSNVIYMPTYQFMSQGKRFDARKVWRNA